MDQDDFKPRKNDFLVEPLFAVAEEPAVLPWYRRVLAWLLRRPNA